MTKRFDFGEILSRAWQIIWKFKVMWIFGILAGCGRSGPAPNSRYSFNDNGPGSYNWPGYDNWVNNIDANQVVPIILGVLLFGLLMIILITAIHSLGQIGLARGTVRAEEEAQVLSFGELLDTKYFRPVFVLNLIVGVAGFLLVMLITIPAVLSLVGMAGTGARTAVPVIVFGVLACLLPLVCVLAIAGWLAGLWITLSQNAVVVENLDVRGGFRRGWQVFRENLVNVVVMGLILGIIGFIANMIIGIPLIIISFPLMLGIIGGAVAGSGGAIISSIILLCLCILVYLPVLLLVSGIINSYTGSAWTLTFMRLAGTPSAMPGTVLPEMPLPPAPEEEIPPAL